jgi:hypothetical protein
LYTIYLCLIRLESEKQYERAAAIAIFHFEIRRAINLLTRASSTEISSIYNLKLVAMALAGYNDQATSKTGLWKDICLDPSILSEIRHPYLRACFTFLCNDSKSFKAVLNEPDILLTDRVAFGCRFLEDQEVVINISLFYTNTSF